MYLKNDKIAVTIKGVLFNSSMVGPTGQFVLDPTAIMGWTDGTAARRDATVRPVSNGDFREPATMSSRLISISGTAVARNAVELQVMRDKFVGLLSQGDYTEMSVETSTGIRYSIVALEGAPSWVIQTDNVAVWKLDLYAPDPVLYGPVKSINIGSTSPTSGGGLKYRLKYPLNYNTDRSKKVNVTVTNEGNIPAFPIFTITGDYNSGFTLLDNRGKKVTYAGAVTLQSPVTIDMARGTAIQNGVDKSVLLTQRQWFSVAQGVVMRPSFIPNQPGIGWCDIMYRDTWI